MTEETVTASDASVLSQRVTCGDLELANPIVMAPLTRLRNSPRVACLVQWLPNSTRSAPVLA